MCRVESQSAGGEQREVAAAGFSLPDLTHDVDLGDFESPGPFNDAIRWFNMHLAVWSEPVSINSNFPVVSDQLVFWIFMQRRWRERPRVQAPQAPTPIAHEDEAPAGLVAVTRVFSFSAVETRRPSECRERESRRERGLMPNSSIFYLRPVSWRNR